jgi:hypothetical protein
MAASKSTGKPAGSLTPALITLHRQLQLHLRPTVERLRLAQSAIITSAFALRHQRTAMRTWRACCCSARRIRWRGRLRGLRGY